MKDHLSSVLDVPVENGEVRQQPQNVFQRMAYIWLRFSGPSLDQFNLSLESQERLRRSRIISILHFLILVSVGIFLPVALINPSAWTPLLILMAFGAVSFLCNRAGFVTTSTLLYILGVDTALTILLVTLPQGLRNSNLPDFDLFLIATLVGGIILPRRFLPFLLAFHICLIVILFTLLPHESLLTQEIIEHGEGFYGEISDAIVLQVVGTSIAWLNSWSVDRTLLRASKAEDLAKAHQRFNDYMQRQVAQKANLEHGIQVLKEAHARFANGDYKARAILQDNELAPLALSFNLLAERLNRVASAALEYARLEQAFQQLFAIRDAIIHRGSLRPFTPTGTKVDQVYPWMIQFYQSRQLSVQYGKAVEKVRLALLRQKVLVTQLKSTLDQTHVYAQILGTETRELTSAFEGMERSQLLCLQVEEQGKLCLQETQQLEQQIKASS